LIALTKVKGVGVKISNMALGIAGVEKTKKTGELLDVEVKKIDEILNDPQKFGAPTWMLNRRKDYDSGEDKHLLTGSLDLQKESDIRRLKKIKSNRGLRHQWGLPVRGQKTKSNFRRNKGKSLGVKRKK